MDESIALSLADVEELAYAALCTSRTSSSNARSVARSIAAAEADGLRSHGLLRLPTYCEHAALGKVNGTAQPSVTRPATGAVCVDACEGFAHPAIEAGFAELVPAVEHHALA